MEKIIKVGCIGLGPRGSYVFKLLLRNPNVKVTAICDKNQEKIDEFKKWLKDEKDITDVACYTDHKEFLNSDVEAVLVATHVETHAAIAADCLYAKKHVLCEIPNIANIDEAKLLAKAVKDNPEAKFMVAENCCYWGFINTWKKMYEEGLLGEVVYAESDYIHMTSCWNLTEEEKKNLPWRAYLPSVTYLTHNLGPILYILNDTCTEIIGFTPDNNTLSDVHPAPVNGVAMVKTKKGALIKIFVGFGVHKREGGHNFSIYGDKGYLENERTGATRKTIGDLSAIPNTHAGITIPVDHGYPGASTEGHGGADIKMVDDFVDCILCDRQPELGIEFGINIALPGIYADLSSREHGKMYKMPTVEEILNS